MQSSYPINILRCLKRREIEHCNKNVKTIIFVSTSGLLAGWVYTFSEKEDYVQYMASSDSYRLIADSLPTVPLNVVLDEGDPVGGGDGEREESAD